MERPVNSANARFEDQREELKRIADSGKCPFCGDYMRVNHPHPITHETDYWYVTKNRWPSDNALHHLLLVHREHISSVDEMSPEAFLDLKQLVTRLCKELGVTGVTLVMRSGDNTKTGGTVTHLHAQLYSGAKDSGKPVLTRVA